jgi:hypothetical protein
MARSGDEYVDRPARNNCRQKDGREGGDPARFVPGLPRFTRDGCNLGADKRPFLRHRASARVLTNQVVVKYRATCPVKYAEAAANRVRRC